MGVVPDEAADGISREARVEQLDLDEVAGQTRATSHSRLGLIRCLQQLLPDHARAWVYYGRYRPGGA